MVAAPSLWLTVPATVLMLVLFLLALRWVTRDDKSVENDWREIDERIKQRR